MAKFNLNKFTTVDEFATAFNEAFGAQVRVYKLTSMVTTSS